MIVNDMKEIGLGTFSICHRLDMISNEDIIFMTLSDQVKTVFNAGERTQQEQAVYSHMSRIAKVLQEQPEITLIIFEKMLGSYADLFDRVHKIRNTEEGK